MRTTGGDIVALRAPVTGRLAQRSPQFGSFLRAGDPVATIEPAGASPTAIVFVPVDTDRRVAAGMPVRLSPADARPDVFGFLRGHVTYAAPFPASADRIKAALQNDAVAAGFSPEVPLREVHIALDVDADGNLIWSGLQNAGRTFRRGRPATPRSLSKSGADLVRASAKPMKLSSGPEGRREAVRTPTVLQMEAVECGAASLGMILGYYGKHVPLEELRVACGVTRDGSSAGNLLRAARSYGLEAHGYKYEVDDLRKVAPPFVIFWQFYHFVVVEGFTKDGAVLNDPAGGRRFCDWEEFDRSYTGVCLTFSPGPDFKRSNDVPATSSILRAQLAGSWGAVLFVILAGLALVVPEHRLADLYKGVHRRGAGRQELRMGLLDRRRGSRAASLCRSRCWSSNSARSCTCKRSLR